MEHRDRVEVLQVESGAADSLCEKVSQETETEAADSQLPLPQALQDLLPRLAGRLSPGEEPLHSLPDLNDEKYGDFFRPEGRECHRRREVRLMLLEAVGNCNSLKSFYSHEVASWHLSVKEWEGLLIHFQATAQFETIGISSLESAEEEALIGLQFQKLISRSFNLRQLILGTGPNLRLRANLGLRAKLVVEVASALRPKQHHELKYLNFYGKGAEGSVMLAVAEIISCAPFLENLTTCNVPRLDGDAKEALSRALKVSARLKNLIVGEELTDVLVEVYSATCAYPVLERLQLMENSKGITAHELTSLIGGNITSIVITRSSESFNNIFTRFSLHEWKSIGRSLLQPPILDQFGISLDLQDSSK